MKKFESSCEFSKKLDSNDSLHHISNLFCQPLHNPIYLCGHSLGLQPKIAKKYIQNVLRDWSDFGVGGHHNGESPWFDYHTFLTEPMTKIVGSKLSETVIMNSLTTNLHLLMFSFYKPNKNKYNIIIDTPSFPSDKYAVQSQLKLHKLNPDKNLVEIDTLNNNKCRSNEEILNDLEKNIKNAAMILFSGVNYYTGQFYDIKSIAKLANRYNCVIGLDLAHAAGNVKLNLNKWGVDFASWCGYKYLNGGPGAPSGVFVHEKYNNIEIDRLQGWWGHNRENRFDPPDKFDPLFGAEGWQLSNPPILSMAALRSSLDLFEEIGIKSIYEKSKNLTNYLEYLINSLNNNNINIITPTQSEFRGAQLSLQINSKNLKIDDYFKSKNIVCDFRKPNVIRIAPNAFYNSYEDIFKFVQVLKDI